MADPPTAERLQVYELLMGLSDFDWGKYTTVVNAEARDRLKGISGRQVQVLALIDHFAARNGLATLRTWYRQVIPASADTTWAQEPLDAARLLSILTDADLSRDDIARAFLLAAPSGLFTADYAYAKLDALVDALARLNASDAEPPLLVFAKHLRDIVGKPIVDWIIDEADRLGFPPGAPPAAEADHPNPVVSIVVMDQPGAPGPAEAWLFWRSPASVIGLGDGAPLDALDGSILAVDVGVGGLSEELLPQGVVVARVASQDQVEHVDGQS
jgi:hypothetical protein